MGKEFQIEDEENRYGYLFEIDKKSFSDDINPDEDYVGEIIWILNKGKKYFKDKPHYWQGNYNIFDLLFQWEKDEISDFLKSCKTILSPLQYKKCVEFDNYDDFDIAGKKLNKHLSNNWKKKIIKLGTPVGNKGVLKFNSVWKFDKENCIFLDNQCANFF